MEPKLDLELEKHQEINLQLDRTENKQLQEQLQ